MWGFGKAEHRDADATDAIVSALLAGAAGTGVAPHAEALAAVEVAAGLWGRSFASASVTPTTSATSTLTPGILRDMGRALALRGEGLWVIDFDGGLVLTQASSWEVEGGPRPESWRYATSTPMPGGRVLKRTMPAEAVIHLRYATRPGAPWQGVSPLGMGSETAALAGWIERRLSEETSTASAYILALPGARGDSTALKADIKAGKGKLLITDTTAGGFGEGAAQAPRKDWESTRLGANPPPSLATLRVNVRDDILSAYGIPSALHGSAASARESYRQMLQSTIAPLSKLVAEELSDKLDVPDLDFDFRELRAADIASRARAYGVLIGAGMDAQEAAEATGLD